MRTAGSTPWGGYVLTLRRLEQASQIDFARIALGSTAQQGKVSRWEAGGSPPNRAADVAAFARALGRNPLEAFVAAGMLSIDEAGRGLAADSRLMLRGLGISSDDNDQIVDAFEQDELLVADEGDVEPGDLE